MADFLITMAAIMALNLVLGTIAFVILLVLMYRRESRRGDLW